VSRSVEKPEPRGDSSGVEARRSAIVAALLAFDDEEVRATQTFLVADHGKSTRRPMVRVGRLAPNTLFTGRAGEVRLGRRL
jgi:hypothetical protein